MQCNRYVSLIPLLLTNKWFIYGNFFHRISLPFDGRCWATRCTTSQRYIRTFTHNHITGAQWIVDVGGNYLRCMRVTLIVVFIGGIGIKKKETQTKKRKIIDLVKNDIATSGTKLRYLLDIFIVLQKCAVTKKKKCAKCFRGCWNILKCVRWLNEILMSKHLKRMTFRFLCWKNPIIFGNCKWNSIRT